MRCLTALFLTFFICLSGTNEAFASGRDLSVEFTYRGESFSVKGEQIDHGTYLFNRGAEKKIWITTLDWAPYIGQDICKQGWVQQFVVALLVSQGYEVKSTFFPWARTIRIAETGKADILYPEWYFENTVDSSAVPDKKRADNLAISRRFPGGPIGFMKRKGTPDIYDGDLRSLKHRRIAVVRGYQHTPEFDALKEHRFFNIHESTNDLQQAKVLLGKRVDLLINDPIAVRYAISGSDFSDERKKYFLDNLEVVKPLIGYNYLHLAVSKKKPGWRKTLDMVNKAILEFESTGILSEIISNTIKDCSLTVDEIYNPYKKDKKQTP